MILFKIASSRNNVVIFSFLFFLIFSFFLIPTVLGQGFAPKVDYATGTNPYGVFAADLDGDNDLDLAVANNVSATVSVFKNNGAGTFAAKVDYGTGGGPISVFAADLDGDNDLDLAVANTGSDTVSVLKNNGDGTFAAKVDYATGTNPHSVFAADLDGDNDLDLAVANNTSHTVSVLKNDGDGTFAAKVDYPTGNFPSSVFAADLDGDGDLDLAVANSGSVTVSVLKNNGDGTLAAKVDYATGSSSSSVFAADLDGDNDLDLAVANNVSNTVSVLKNNGAGTFAAKVDYPTGAQPRSVFAADLDVDGDLDLAVANFNSNTVSVFKNNGDGTFAARVNYTTGTNPQYNSLFAADLDGDTDKDLAVANYGSNTVSVLKNLIYTPYVEQILSIADIPNDQGRWLRLKWKSLPGNDPFVTQFAVFRRVDSGFVAITQSFLTSEFAAFPPGNWEQVGTFAAFGDTLYQAVVPTTKDSTAQAGIQWSVFFVRAVGANPLVFFDSPIDSGYSLDNLLPSPPANLQATGTAAIASLHWSPVSDEDFDFYYIYRDTLSGFSLSPAKRVKATSDTLASDTLSNPNKAYYYRVTSVDFSGNESSPSSQVQLCTGKAGDANGTGAVNLADIIALVNHVFKGALKPSPACRGDANASGTINLPDIIYEVNFVFKGGPAPIKSGVCCL